MIARTVATAQSTLWSAGRLTHSAVRSDDVGGKFPRLWSVRKLLRLRPAALLVALSLLSGCTVGPNYHAQKVYLSRHYGEVAAIAGSQTNIHALENPPPEEWWREFKDPRLDKLVTQALSQNLDLKIAVTRVREARYQRSIVAADLFPNIDADAGYLHARGSKNVQFSLGSGGGSSGGAANGSASGSSAASPAKQAESGSEGGSGNGGGARAGGNPFGDQLTPFGKGGLPGVSSSLYQIGFDSTWELDVFGGNRRRLEAAAHDLTAAVENLHDVTLTLIAEVARNYLELRGAQNRLAVARKNLDGQKEILQLTLSRADSGLTSRADVSRASAQVALTASSIPPLEASTHRSIHILSTLLGREPSALAQQLEASEPLPLQPPVVPVGLPSELLKRRPDIRRAEQQIAAATARIGSAKADLFPRFAMTGSVGLDSTSPENLFNWGSRYFLISPTVSWRVFDAGRIVSNVALQKANRAEAVYNYQNTILIAFREVEDALVTYAREQERKNSLAEALAQTRESFSLIRDQYEHGLATFIEVLDAQRNVLSTEDQLAISDQTLATDVVSLCKSLGGGWRVAAGRSPGVSPWGQTVENHFFGLTESGHEPISHKRTAYRH